MEANGGTKPEPSVRTTRSSVASRDMAEENKDDFSRYECPVCNKVFLDDSTFIDHAQKHGKGVQKSKKCTVCQQSFSTYSKLILHSMTHTKMNVPDSKCHICGKILCNSVSLKRHLKMHSDEDNSLSSDRRRKQLKPRKKQSDISPQRASPRKQSSSAKLDSQKKDTTESKTLFLTISNAQGETVYSTETDYANLQNVASLCEKNFTPSNDTGNPVSGSSLGEEPNPEPLTEEKEETEEKPVISEASFISASGHICSICDRTTKSLEGLLSHYQTHSSRLIRKKGMACSVCMEKFTSHDQLSAHIQEHTEAGHSCTVCLAVFSTAKELRKHKQAHKSSDDDIEQVSGGKMFESCHICGKYFSPSYIQKHLLLHEKGTVIRPGRRSKQSIQDDEPSPSKNREKCQSLDSLNDRNLVISEDKEALEDGGGDVAMDLAEGAEEMQEGEGKMEEEKGDKDEDDPDYLQEIDSLENASRKKAKTEECYICGKVVQKYYMKKHLSLHEGGKDVIKTGRTKKAKQIQDFMCSTCGIKLTNQLSLKEHETTHTGERPHECKICGKRIRHISTFQRHLMIHTQLKPYVCDQCGTAFKDKTTLRSHEKIHTGIRPHQCEKCEKKFLRHDHLKTHMRIHTGEKPYKCKFCPKVFAQLSPLYVHIRNVHKETVENMSGEPYEKNMSAEPSDRHGEDLHRSGKEVYGKDFCGGPAEDRSLKLVIKTKQTSGTNDGGHAQKYSNADEAETKSATKKPRNSTAKFEISKIQDNSVKAMYLVRRTNTGESKKDVKTDEPPRKVLKVKSTDEDPSSSTFVPLVVPGINMKAGASSENQVESNSGHSTTKETTDQVPAVLQVPESGTDGNVSRFKLDAQQKVTKRSASPGRSEGSVMQDPFKALLEASTILDYTSSISRSEMAEAAPDVRSVITGAMPAVRPPAATTGALPDVRLSAITARALQDVRTSVVAARSLLDVRPLPIQAGVQSNVRTVTSAIETVPNTTPLPISSGMFPDPITQLKAASRASQPDTTALLPETDKPNSSLSNISKLPVGSHRSTEQTGVSTLSSNVGVPSSQSQDTTGPTVIEVSFVTDGEMPSGIDEVAMDGETRRLLDRRVRVSDSSIQAGGNVLVPARISVTTAHTPGTNAVLNAGFLSGDAEGKEDKSIQMDLASSDHVKESSVVTESGHTSEVLGRGSDQITDFVSANQHTSRQNTAYEKLVLDNISEETDFPNEVSLENKEVYIITLPSHAQEDIALSNEVIVTTQQQDSGATTWENSSVILTGMPNETTSELEEGGISASTLENDVGITYIVPSSTGGMATMFQDIRVPNVSFRTDGDVRGEANFTVAHGQEECLEPLPGEMIEAVSECEVKTEND